jgi:hypothetical protein
MTCNIYKILALKPLESNQFKRKSKMNVRTKDSENMTRLNSANGIRNVEL